jgi:lipopolysaccharide transport system permease protein
MVIYALFMAYFGVSLVGLLFYPIIFGLFCLLILGLSFAFSTIGVYANDLGNVWVVIGRMLFFLTPIFYAPSGEGAVFLFNRINPLFQFINLARDVMVYGAWPATTNLAYVLSLSVLTFLLGLSLFQRYKRSFAERL